MVSHSPDNETRIASGMCVGVPVSMIVWSLNKYAFGFDMGSWLVYFKLLGYCVVISTAISVLYFLIANRSFTPKTDGAIIATASRNRFLDRLPRHLGTNLLHIASEDHYVKATTELGSHMVLMRFSDALEELEAMDGIQIHRSHWVTRSGIDTLLREDGKLVVRTINEQTIPVSRGRVKQVKGFIKTKE